MTVMPFPRVTGPRNFHWAGQSAGGHDPALADGETFMTEFRRHRAVIW